MMASMLCRNVINEGFFVECRGWRPLVFYTGTHITLLYLNQLPVELPQSVVDAADYMGLFKVSKADLGWPEGIQLIALFALYILVLSF